MESSSLTAVGVAFGAMLVTTYVTAFAGAAAREKWPRLPEWVTSATTDVVAWGVGISVFVWLV
jgi:hypothetical protein